MNTEKAKVSPLYLQLIEGMHQDKLKINVVHVSGEISDVS